MKRTLVLNALDADWQLVAGTRRATRQLRDWQRDHPCLDGFKNLEQLVDAVRSCAVDRSTELVWALLAIAETDELAVRTVLQIVVPGLGGELGWLLEWARRTDPRLVADGDLDQLLAAAGMEAVRHAIGQRRNHPVVSILRRAHRVLLRETGVEEQWHRTNVLTQPGSGAATDGEISPGAMLGSVLGQACATGTVSRQDAALVWLTRIGGYEPGELSDRFAATGACLRRRRHRAEARLARWAEAV